MRDENDLLMAPDVKCYFAIHCISLTYSFKFPTIKKLKLKKKKILKNTYFT